MSGRGMADTVWIDTHVGHIELLHDGRVLNVDAGRQSSARWLAGSASD